MMKSSKQLFTNSISAGLLSRAGSVAIPLWLSGAALCVPAAGQTASTADQSAGDLVSKSLEELMDIKVTSAPNAVI
ncbi:MAG TPA: hypothetical protein VI756_03460 [Blastocatellia bacterium]